MSKYVCLNCGEVYDTNLIKFDVTEDWNFCPKSNCLGQVVELDDNMVAPILHLNMNDIYTKYCCGGHIKENSCAPYISFDDDTMEYEEMILLKNALLIYLIGVWKEENFINYSILSNNLFSYQNITSQTEETNLSEYITPNQITSSLCIRGIPGYYLLNVDETREYNNLRKQIYVNYITLMDFADAFLQKKQGYITEKEYKKRELSEDEVNYLFLVIQKNYKELSKLENLMEKEYRNADYLTQQYCINQLNDVLCTIIGNIVKYINKERTCLNIIGWEKVMCGTYYGLTTETKEKITKRVQDASDYVDPKKCESCKQNCSNCPISDENAIKEETKYETLQDFLTNIN